MDETRLEIERADARAAMETEGEEIECSRCHDYFPTDEIGRGPWQWICHSCDELETQHRISKL